MAEEELRLNISAKEEASARIKLLTESLRILNAEMAKLSGVQLSSGYAQKIREETAAITGEIAALKAQTSAMQQQAATAITLGQVVNSNITNNARLATTEVRHLVGAFDGLARGQRGQVISSIGAAMRDAGLGATSLITSVGILTAVMAGLALGREVENLGAWSRQLQAGAEATGMSISSYARLADALTLLGQKSNAADTSLRIFAKSMDEAAANASSRAATAFHNLGISQEEIIVSGGNVYNLLMKVADAYNNDASSASKDDNAQALFGRGIENIIPLLEHMQDVWADVGATGVSPQMLAAFDEMERRAKELSLHVSRELRQAFLDWKDAIDLAISALDKLGQGMSFISNLMTSGKGLENIIAPEQPPFKDVTVPIAPGPYPSSKRNVPSLGPQISAYEQLQDQIEQAKLAAAQKVSGGNITGIDASTSLRIAETTAAIKTLQAALADNKLDPKERMQAERELASEQLQLINERVSMEVKATKQTYDAFAAGEKEKIAAARGGINEIDGIYKQWISQLPDFFKGKQLETMTLRIKTEMLDADTKSLLKTLSEQHQTFNIDLKINEENKKLADTVKQGYQPKADMSFAATYNEDAAAIRVIIDELNKQAQGYEKIITDSNQSSEAQQQAVMALKQAYAEALEQVNALASAIQEAGIKANEAFSKPFIQAFDQLGEQVERFSESLLQALVAPREEIERFGLKEVKVNMQGNEIRSAASKLFMGLADDLVKSVETALSHLAAQGLASLLNQSIGPGAGLGSLLGKGLSSLFSSGASAAVTPVATSAVSSVAGQATGAVSTTAPIVAAVGTSATGISASVAANAATISSAIATSTATLVSALGASTSSETAALTAIAVKPEALGFSYAQGGIVPSAAGGMVVGGGSGGIPAILHPREMVLPKNLSEGIQGMINNGGNLTNSQNRNANLNYSPNINVEGGRNAGGSLTDILDAHAGQFIGEARNMVRAGWR